MIFRCSSVFLISFSQFPLILFLSTSFPRIPYCAAISFVPNRRRKFFSVESEQKHSQQNFIIFSSCPRQNEAYAAFKHISALIFNCLLTFSRTFSPVFFYLFIILCFAIHIHSSKIKRRVYCCTFICNMDKSVYSLRIQDCIF